MPFAQIYMIEGRTEEQKRGEQKPPPFHGDARPFPIGPFPRLQHWYTVPRQPNQASSPRYHNAGHLRRLVVKF